MLNYGKEGQFFQQIQKVRKTGDRGVIWLNRPTVGWPAYFDHITPIDLTTNHGLIPIPYINQGKPADAENFTSVSSVI